MSLLSLGCHRDQPSLRDAWPPLLVSVAIKRPSPWASAGSPGAALGVSCDNPGSGTAASLALSRKAGARGGRPRPRGRGGCRKACWSDPPFLLLTVTQRRLAFAVAPDGVDRHQVSNYARRGVHALGSVLNSSPLLLFCFVYRLPGNLLCAH